MIEKMEKIYICSLKSHTAVVMETLMRCGAVQTVKTKSMISADASKLLMSKEKTALSDLESLMKQIQEGIAVLKPLGASKGLLQKRPGRTYEELMDPQMHRNAAELCVEIQRITDGINALEKDLKKAEFRMTSFLPWQAMNLTAEDMQTNKCSIRCCTIPGPYTIDNLCRSAEEQNLALYGELVSEEQEHQYIAVLFQNKDENDVRKLIRFFDGKVLSHEGMTGSFGETAELCGQKIRAVKQEIWNRQRKLEQMADKKALLEQVSDAVSLKIKYLSEQKKFLCTDKVDVIAGWIPVSRKGSVSRKLSQYACFYEYDAPQKDEEHPVLLKNSRLVKPFGAITEMYSLPDSRSIDTNWVIGLFFFLFFGMMLSDAGYGLVLLIGGLAGAKIPDLGDGAKQMMKMIGICGISTMFWGALYGSWFGDAVPQAAQAFLGKTIVIPRLLDPLKEPMTILILSCALGVVHLFTGMGIKAYLMIRRGDKWGALFDVGFWYVFLIGLALLLASRPWRDAGTVLSILGAAGLILTQGRSRPTILGKLVSGVMSLYHVTGFFSDVLSYSRILALGLATGVVGSVVNIMGTMPGGNLAGAVLFPVIFTAGHLLNLGINALGAYVHAARLQYVEFFGTYYEGGGSRFEPLKIETKYVRITEEN